MPFDLKDHDLGIRVNLAAASPDFVQVYARNFESDQKVTLFMVNFALAPGLGVPYAMMTVRVEQFGGFGAGTVSVFQLGPGETAQIEVARQVTVSARTSIDGPLGVWPTFQEDTLINPPELGPFFLPATPLPAGVFTPIRPNNGFCPSRNRWLYCWASGNFDLQLEDDNGVVQITYAGLVPPVPDPFLIPPGLRVSAQSAAGNIAFMAVWTWRKNA